MKMELWSNLDEMLFHYFFVHACQSRIFARHESPFALERFVSTLPDFLVPMGIVERATKAGASKLNDTHTNATIIAS